MSMNALCALESMNNVLVTVAVEIAGRRLRENWEGAQIRVLVTPQRKQLMTVSQ